MRERDIFIEALERSNGPERTAFVCEACGSDGALRERVNRLLANHACTNSFLLDRAVSRIVEHANPEGPGQLIGRYKLLQLIGEGGFGEVWMAEQGKPVNRRIALKIIKLGMDTKQVIARFDAERQALAMMEHPNIARVHDAGATDTGRPYFVMELVDGVPITTFCDAERFTVRQRIKLFIDVCNAVQHAHTKGVVHRDIKPSNVLVAMQDGQPTPKVIDFGIAKAIDQPLTDKTLLTEARQLIGTPEYMSPEQAQLGGTDVDTRSDVYSLGVLLYELLAGCTPFDHKELRESSIDELRRIIREVEPTKPSTRLSTLAGHGRLRGQRRDEAEDAPQAKDDSGAAALPRTGVNVPSSLVDVARQRSTDPPSLRRVLQGDLDWIAIKCLEKDRTRRYESPSALAADLGRHLAGEPVVAAPPSRAYRLRKFVARNRGVVAAGLAVALALVLGTVGTSIGLVRANQRAAELERVVDYQDALLADLDIAQMSERLRQDLRARLRAALELDGASQADISAAEGELDRLHEQISFRDVVIASLDGSVFQRALQVIEEQFADVPLLQARLFESTARTMGHLGLHMKAVEPQRRAHEIHERELGPDHFETLRSKLLLAKAYKWNGELDQAERHLRTLVQTARQDLGTDHRLTLTAINQQGVLWIEVGEPAKAEPCFREVMEVGARVLGEEDTLLRDAMGNLAAALACLGRLDEAEMLYRRAQKDHRRHTGKESLWIDLFLGGTLHRQGKFEEAESLLRQALEGYRDQFGDEYVRTNQARWYLLELLRDMGRLDEAQRLGAEAVRYTGNTWGETSPDFRLKLMLIHAQTLMRAGELVEAKELLDEVQGRIARIPHDIVTWARDERLAQTYVEYYEALCESDPVGGHEAELEAWRSRFDAAQQAHAGTDEDGHDEAVVAP